MTKKLEYIIVLISVGVFVYIFPKLSKLGFHFSEYLSKAHNLNYLLTILLIVAGVTDCYRRIRFTRLSSFSQGIACYISFSIAMSGIYQLAYLSHENCFLFPSSVQETPTIIDFTYFSFITVTTVGYGDIVPKHTFVRALVLIQVVCGLMLVLRSTKIEH